MGGGGGKIPRGSDGGRTGRVGGAGMGERTSEGDPIRVRGGQVGKAGGGGG